MRQGDGHGGISGKGTLAGEHFIANDAERIDVGSRRDILSLCLLGGHILCGAYHHAGASKRHGCGRLGNAKVRDLDLAILRNEQVAGLNIAVHELHAVNDGQAMCSLLEDVESQLLLERIFARQQVCKGFATDVFQGHETEFAAVVFQLAVVIGSYHVLGLNRFGRFRLVAETREELLVIGKFRA